MASASSSPGAAALPRKRACRCCDMNVKPIIQPPPPVLGTGEDEDDQHCLTCQNISGDQQNLTDCSDCSNIKITGEVDMSTNYNIPPGHTVTIDYNDGIVFQPNTEAELTITNHGNIITNNASLHNGKGEERDGYGDAVSVMVNYGDISGVAVDATDILPPIDNYDTITMNGVTATTQCSTTTELFGFPISNGWKIGSKDSSYCCIPCDGECYPTTDFAGRCIDQAAVCIDIDACANISTPPPTPACLSDLSAGYCNPCPVSSHIDFSAALTNPLCRSIELTSAFADTSLNIPDDKQLIILKGGKLDVSNITVGNNGGITIGEEDGLAGESGGIVNCSGKIIFGDITGGMGITIYDGSGNFKDVSFGNISDDAQGILILGGEGTFTGKVSFGNISGMGIDIKGGEGIFTGNVSFGDISGGGVGIDIEGGVGIFYKNVSFGNIRGSWGVILSERGAAHFNNDVYYNDISDKGRGLLLYDGDWTYNTKIKFLGNIDTNSYGIYFNDQSNKIIMKGEGVCVGGPAPSSISINNVCYDAAAREMSGNCIMNGITGPGDVSSCQ